MIAFLTVGAVVLGLDPHMPLLWGYVLTGLVGRYCIGITWDELFHGVADSLRMGMQALLILFVMGLTGWEISYTGEGDTPDGIVAEPAVGDD